MASLYAILGEKDRAFEWLDRADRGKDEWFLLIPVDPYVDPLRSDPRFAKLLEQAKNPIELK